MAVIKENFGFGGANLTPDGGAGQPTLAEVLRNFVSDNEETRTQFIALLAKLDLDAGVSDTDYESTLTPANLDNELG